MIHRHLRVRPETPAEDADLLGLYRFIDVIVPGRWIVAVEPVLIAELTYLMACGSVTEQGATQFGGNFAFDTSLAVECGC